MVDILLSKMKEIFNEYNDIYILIQMNYTLMYNFAIENKLEYSMCLHIKILKEI